MTIAEAHSTKSQVPEDRPVLSISDGDIINHFKRLSAKCTTSNVKVTDIEITYNGVL